MKSVSIIIVDLFQFQFLIPNSLFFTSSASLNKNSEGIPVARLVALAGESAASLRTSSATLVSRTALYVGSLRVSYNLPGRSRVRSLVTLCPTSTIKTADL